MLAFQARSVHVDLELNSEATVETDAAADTEHEEVGLNHAELSEETEPNSEATVETDAAADTEHEEVGLNHAELSEETEPNSEATVETDAAADTEHEEVGLNHAELSEETEPNSEATVETDAAADTEHEEVGINHAELSEETGVDTIAETRSEDKEMPSSSNTNDNSSPSITQLFGLKAEEITEEGLANLKKFPFVTKSVSNIIRRTGPHGSKKPHDRGCPPPPSRPRSAKSSNMSTKKLAEAQISKAQRREWVQKVSRQMKRSMKLLTLFTVIS